MPFISYYATPFQNVLPRARPLTPLFSYCSMPSSAAFTTIDAHAFSPPDAEELSERLSRALFCHFAAMPPRDDVFFIRLRHCAYASARRCRPDTPAIVFAFT